jgi:preprotein translocase subunit SecY
MKNIRGFNMDFFSVIARLLPEVKKPTQKKVDFKEKLKWTLLTLAAFFILQTIPLLFLSTNAKNTFAELQVILAASFGSLLSLGIGPIVTASIVLQLLNGAGIWKFDLRSPQGKAHYQAVNKVFAVIFIVVEAVIYTYMGGLSAGVGAPAWHNIAIIGQLIVGGLLVMLMDDLLQKWGFGSGISLFIAAGVSQSIFYQIFSFTTRAGTSYSVGKLWQIFQAIGAGQPADAIYALGAIAFTVIVFGGAVYVQSMKVEVPLTFGRMRGHGYRWPLNFMYTSNLPVILIAATLANVQLVASFIGPGAQAAVRNWVSGPDMLSAIVYGNVSGMVLIQALVYILIMTLGAVLFSMMWVQTSNMDARSVAKQMIQSGAQMSGFRRDERVLESVLKRYITPLTVMGGITVGLIAAVADLTGALGRGTGILLTVMIIYKLYEDIAKQHMTDFNPSMKKFMGR